MTSFDTFLRWEAKSRDTIDFKKAYVDMAGDVIAGLMLSQIVYWYLPGQSEESKLRVERDGKRWLVKSRHDWWDECRLSPREADRARKTLEEAGLIEVRLYKFNGSPTQHLRIREGEFLEAWQAAIEGIKGHPGQGGAGGGPAAEDGSGSGEPGGSDGAADTANLPKGFKSADGKEAASQANPLKRPISPNGEIHFTDSLNAFHQNGKMDFTKRLNPKTEITTEITSETTAAAEPPTAEGPDADATLVRELIAHGVGRGVASRLAKEKPDVCRRYLEYLPFAQCRTTAGAWLANAIRDEYGPPAGYVQAKLREAGERQARERTLAEKARQSHEDARRREKNDRLMERYSLMEQEQGKAYAAFTEHVARERARVSRIALHLSPERRAEQLAAFDSLEHRLQLFDEWLTLEERKGALARAASRSPPGEGRGLSTPALP
jgi:hypothetical protein